MIYVDDAFIPKDKDEWCHLMADSLDELHQFAQSIGLKREWFHSGDHYDVTRGKRFVAIRTGAKKVTTTEMVEIRRRLRRAGKEATK